MDFIKGKAEVKESSRILPEKKFQTYEKRERPMIKPPFQELSESERKIATKMIPEFKGSSDNLTKSEKVAESARLDTFPLFVEKDIKGELTIPEGEEKTFKIV